jgi:hypothetical protein
MPVWIANALNYAERFDGVTYWLLLTKGYKTYKFLHTFMKEFYPRVDCDTPNALREIIDDFAAAHFGARYKNGVVEEGKDYLKSNFARIPQEKLHDKNTAFFLEKNPGYTAGNELVCIAELSAENLNRLGRKVLGR